jgi:hypothetical protein
VTPLDARAAGADPKIDSPVGARRSREERQGDQHRGKEERTTHGDPPFFELYPSSIAIVDGRG